jgi:hypothetical protein
MGIAAIRRWLDRRFGRESVVASEPFVPPTALDRPLTEYEDAALRWILWLEDFPAAHDLRAQVPHVRATFGRTTELQLEVIDAEPALVPDGILPVDALVVGDDEEPIGFISVWVQGGYLASIEYSWFTDDMPRVFPSADRLRLTDWEAPRRRPR